MIGDLAVLGGAWAVVLVLCLGMHGIDRVNRKAGR